MTQRFQGSFNAEARSFRRVSVVDVRMTARFSEAIQQKLALG